MTFLPPYYFDAFFLYFGKSFQNKTLKKKVLVAALDWGLGHATRCMAIIRRLAELDAEVIIASSGDAGLCLQKAFPALVYEELPSYSVRLSASNHQGLILLKQWPGIKEVIRREHEIIDDLAFKHDLEVIISDNRYGLWHPRVPSVFITHQLSPVPPVARVVMTPFIRKFHYRLISHFNHCWVCDYPGDENLSGRLSHGITPPEGTTYIGPLSQFERQQKEPDLTEPIDDFVAVLSGPKPQRSLLERNLIRQCVEQGFRMTLVRGLIYPDHISLPDGPRETFSYLTTDQLYNTIIKAKVILSRPGYTSLMDYAFLGKKAILIPTPGQTEQEYLAKYHQRKGHYYSESQSDFNLGRALEASEHYQGISIDPGANLLDPGLKKLLGR